MIAAIKLIEIFYVNEVFRLLHLLAKIRRIYFSQFHTHIIALMGDRKSAIIAIVYFGQ